MLRCLIFLYSTIQKARIVLDDFHIVLHSSDSIAPVGVLHPLNFHVESKATTISVSDSNGISDLTADKLDSVFEVRGDCLGRCDAKCQSLDDASALIEAPGHKLNISKTKREDTFTIGCSLQVSSSNPTGLSPDKLSLISLYRPLRFA